ncbi:hypothetical protein RCH12_000459 [Cryobacterium sp. MP_3.1]|nr:hypothetical protein [Cryobacterium sp. MP_3.1]
MSFSQPVGSYFPERTYFTQVGTFLPLARGPLSVNGWKED